MKVLIIEDDNNKIKQLNDFLQSTNIFSTILVKKSYQSGLKEILSNTPNLVILDMSLPTYDISENESGYKFRPFGGQDILSEMKRKKIMIPTIIFTQFESFGEGSNFTTLDELKNQLLIKYSDIYFGTIYYSASETIWRNQLLNLINSLSMRE